MNITPIQNNRQNVQAFKGLSQNDLNDIIRKIHGKHINKESIPEFINPNKFDLQNGKLISVISELKKRMQNNHIDITDLCEVKFEKNA